MLGGGLWGRGLEEEHGRTKDEDSYTTGNGPVLTLTFVMMALILHCPLQASVRYTPLVTGESFKHEIQSRDLPDSVTVRLTLLMPYPLSRRHSRPCGVYVHHAGASLFPGRAIRAGYVLSEVPDKDGEIPGWGLGARLTSSPHKDWILSKPWQRGVRGPKKVRSATEQKVVMFYVD